MQKIMFNDAVSLTEATLQGRKTNTRRDELTKEDKMKTETFVTFEQAQTLKRLGFDWECNAYYMKKHTDSDEMELRTYLEYYNHNAINWFGTPCYSAPALHIAAKWFREVKDIDVCAFFDNEDRTWRWFYGDMNSPFKEDAVFDFELSYETYEAALSAGITAELKELEEKANDTCKEDK